MSAARVGAVVRVGLHSFQLLSRAEPSGWWAVPCGGGCAVRLLGSDRRGFRLAREHRP